LVSFPLVYRFDPFRFEDRVLWEVIVFFIFSYLRFVLGVELDGDELDDDLVRPVFDACP